MTENEIKKFAEKIANLHYPNTPNNIIDEHYKKVRIKTLRQQIIEELSERQLTTEVSEQNENKALNIADVRNSVFCCKEITNCFHYDKGKCILNGDCLHKTDC